MIAAFAFGTILEEPPLAQTHRRLCRRSGRCLHHPRSAALRHEHKPGGNSCFRRAGAALDGAVDLFYRATDWQLSAAELYLRTNGARGVGCAKLHHDNLKRCIFCGKPAGQRQ